MNQPRAVEAEIEIERDPGAVMQALTDVTLLQQWWSVHCGLVDARAGGAWALAWDVPQEGFGFVVLSGVIEQLSANEALRIGSLVFLNKNRAPLGPMSLSFELRPSPAGSHLKVCQAGYLQGGDWDWYFQLVTENWPPALLNLKRFLESQP